MTMHPSGGETPPVSVALITYSTKPRGGVVHSVYLAEALHRLGHPIRLFALGDPHRGLFRTVDAPCTILPAPEPAGTLEDRVWQTADALLAGLRSEVAGRFDIVHTQDCIAARAGLWLRDEHPDTVVVRTVHHVDDFTTPSLVQCQQSSIVEPDHVLVVSEQWRRLLLEHYGVGASVVSNGVDAARFSRADGSDGHLLRARIAADRRFVWLTVGGIEPRKGSHELIEALGSQRAGTTPSALLVVVGGHSFQDHSAYRESVLQRAEQLGLKEGQDYVILGTVPDSELVGWYHAADAFVFPSVKEGWGLVVLEAMAAQLPVVTTDIPVFREYLETTDAVLVPPANPAALARAMTRVASDAGLRERLAGAGPRVAGRYTWDHCAHQHAALYRKMITGRGIPPGAPQR
jgi:glycosyltransferase-like protein